MLLRSANVGTLVNLVIVEIHSSTGLHDEMGEKSQNRKEVMAALICW